MKRIIVIVGLTYLFFLLEFLMFNAFGSWGKPNLLVVLIVFLNLYLGIRYGLMAAFAAGVLKDAFSTQVFGIHIFLFMSCAFLATILRRNFYRPGSRLSRLVVTGGVVVFFIFNQSLFFAMNSDMEWSGVLGNVFFPELTATMLCATFVFTRLKYLADKIRL